MRHRFDVHVVESTGSTNSDLLGRASSAPSGTVLAAERQTAGRGRRGRQWVAPPSGSLAFSVLWKFQRGAAALSGLSLAVGLAVAQALDQCGARSLGLKWPNDLLVGDSAGWRKAGGILVELAVEPALPGATHGMAAAVIGIGLNVDLGSADHLIDQPVSDLRRAGGTTDRNALIAAILGQLGAVLPGFAEHGFGPFAAQWMRRHVWQGQAVSLCTDDAPSKTGVAAGVDDDGALLLETPDGVERIVSGDVSLRRVE